MIHIVLEGTNNNILNNITYNDYPQNSTWRRNLRINEAAILGMNEVDYNLYETTDPIQTFFSGASSYIKATWESYKSTLGFDANSPAPTDPLFTTASSDTFYIDNNSPAYNAGTNLWFITTDYYGNLRDDGTFDIGAHEYTP